MTKKTAVARIQQTNQESDLAKKRQLNVRPDTADFRDMLYVPTLVEVPPTRSLAIYQRAKVPILDQGSEGACTGFALATVANYLLRTRSAGATNDKVSPQMLYALARRYDEWPGEKYEGSSARGAMKGWHKHGVCTEKLWPYRIDDVELKPSRAEDALQRPLGAYFRVNHKDLVAMHSAISEVGILYATATVHTGWDAPKSGVIRHTTRIEGGHAFAIVGYDERGFFVQNSWGPSWGKGGFALLTYDDWLENGSDVWVARLGAPVSLKKTDPKRTAISMAAKEGRATDFYELRPHIISIGNDGQLRTNGLYGNTAADVQSIFAEMETQTKKWAKKRIVVYAHGGLVPEDDAIAKVANYRARLLEREVYPLSFIWKTDAITTLKNIFEDAIRRRRPEGPLDAAKQFLIEKLDDTIEWAARGPGKPIWDEIKENGVRATAVKGGGAALVAAYLKQLVAKDPAFEIHVVGHSAGSIFLGPFLELLTTEGKITRDDATLGLDGFATKVATATLWAPACTNDFFAEYYARALVEKRIGRLALFTLSDKAERDDTCAGLYNKSLLYLVSHALEKEPRIPRDRIREKGWPILGMAKFAEAAVKDLVSEGVLDWIVGPNGEPVGNKNACAARTHGGFDDDEATLHATLARILAQDAGGKQPLMPPIPALSDYWDIRHRINATHRSD